VGESGKKGREGTTDLTLRFGKTSRVFTPTQGDSEKGGNFSSRRKEKDEGFSWTKEEKNKKGPACPWDHRAKNQHAAGSLKERKSRPHRRMERGEKRRLGSPFYEEPSETVLFEDVSGSECLLKKR